MKTGVRLGSALAVLVLCGAAGCHKESSAAAESGDSARPAVPVQTARVVRTTLRPSIDLIGTVVADPERMATLCARISAPVEELGALEGTHVEAGNVVVRQSREKVEADRVKAAATADESRAALTRLVAGPREQEVEVARKEVERAEVTVESARSKLDAIRTLHQRKEAPDRQLEEAQRALKTTEAERTASEARLRLLELGPRKEQIAEAEAHLAIAQADLAATQLQCDWAEVKSPIDGEVVELKARRGMQVDPGAALATVVDMTEVQVQARLPAARLAEVRSGMASEVRSDAMPGRPLEGRVFRLAYQGDEQAGDIPIWFTVSSPDKELRLGMVVQVRVYTAEIPDALVIPEQAVADQNGVAVATIVENGASKTVMMKLGTRAAGLVQVLEGLNEGDEVTTEGGYGLPPGTPVVVVKPPGTETSQEPPPRRSD
jgi:multidrug efflux pump subunit AcrA (membrane-fusion protein)